MKIKLLLWDGKTYKDSPDLPSFCGGLSVHARPHDGRLLVAAIQAISFISDDAVTIYAELPKEERPAELASPDAGQPQTIEELTSQPAGYD